MKNLLLTFSLLTFLLTLPSIGFAVETPTFVKVKEWHLEKIGTKKMVLSCKAVFYNPNKAKAKISDIDISFLFGETKAGRIDQLDKVVKVKKNAAFEIPLRIELNPETNAWSYLTGVLSALTMNDFVVNVRGKINLKILGLPVKLSIDESETLNLKSLL